MSNDTGTPLESILRKLIADEPYGYFFVAEEQLTIDRTIDITQEERDFLVGLTSDAARPWAPLSPDAEDDA